MEAIDPFPHALIHRLPRLFGQYGWHISQAFDSNETFHGFRIDTRLAQGDVRTQRMGDDGDRCELLLINKLGQIVNEWCHPVIAVT